MQTGSGWPYINFSELNMDWIFRVLIPEVKSLKESYDNIQEIVRNITQENYNQWKAELQTEMSRLQTQITQANESWKQTFTAQNAAWQQQAQNTLNTRFSEYVTTTNAAIEVWEHDAYERLIQLINSFAESITEAEANAKAYADRLNAELRGYVEQQLHFLNDEVAATNLKLELQVNALNAKIAQLKSDMTEWQQQLQTEMDSFKQDVNTEVSEFEDRVEQKINQHKEWVQQQLVSINNNIMEQVRVLNERISNLTAADIGAIDPITGEEEDVQFVLRHMFDVFSEYNGCITAGEYKQLGITAGEYKEKYNYNAILYSVASYWLLKIRKWERPAFYYNGEYVTPAELEQRLMEYITKAAVDAELADYALTNDVDQKLAQYIKTKDMISYLATTLENYVTYDALQNTLRDYARPEDLQQLQTELNQKATQEQLESLRQAVYDEFDNYAKLSELPDFSEFLKSSEAADTFATLDDLNKYALKTELPDVSGLLSKAEAADQYALKTELPDVSGLLSKAEAADQYALKTELPDVSGLLSKAEAADQYALKTELPDIGEYVTLEHFETAMNELNSEMSITYGDLSNRIDVANTKIDQLPVLQQKKIGIVSNTNLPVRIYVQDINGDQPMILNSAAAGQVDTAFLWGAPAIDSIKVNAIILGRTLLHLSFEGTSPIVFMLSIYNTAVLGNDYKGSFNIGIEFTLTESLDVDNPAGQYFPVMPILTRDYGQPMPPYNIQSGSIFIVGNKLYLDIKMQYSGDSHEVQKKGGLPDSITFGLWRYYSTLRSE